MDSVPGREKACAKALGQEGTRGVLGGLCGWKWRDQALRECGGLERVRLDEASQLFFWHLEGRGRLNLERPHRTSVFRYC